MGLPKNWKIEDIFYLKKQMKLKHKEIISFVERYNDIDEALNDGNLNDGSLFQSNKNYTKEFESFIEQQFSLIEKHNITLVTYWDEGFPILLKNISSPPIVLFVKGQLKNKDDFIFSIVGTRRPSMTGKLIAEKFTQNFTNKNIILASGLAFGIDYIIHNTTIKNNGITYAIIAQGINTLRASSQKLAEKIVDSGGAIISEHFMDITARPGYFPVRNRIISGIAKATLVIESDLKGGSMITAKFAFEQNRDLFAVPGPINANQYNGCNVLIYKNMAIPALSTEQILKEVGFEDPSNNEKKENQNIKELEGLEKEIFNILGHEPIHIDQIANILNQDIITTSVHLLNLEFNDLIKQLPGKYFIKSL